MSIATYTICRSGRFGVYRWSGKRPRRLYVGNFTQARRKMKVIERYLERKHSIMPFIMLKALAPFRVHLVPRKS